MLCQSAQRVHGGGLTFVSVTVGERDANLKDVGRAHKAAPISARHMEEVRDALGASQSRSLAKVMELVTHLLGGRPGYVHPMALWCRTNVFMAVPHLDLWSKILNPVNQRRRKRLSIWRIRMSIL